MARKKTAASLSIFLNNLHLGTLGYKSKKFLTFRYSQDWLGRKNTFPVSRTLPLREDPFAGEEVYAYFDNLLPDGTPVRQRLAARMRAPSDQVFDLLSVVGRDCIGALRFVKEGEEDTTSLKPRGTPISEKKIAERLRNLKMVPLAASEEENFRISIAGAQEKTALLKLNGKWNVPLDATPTTHIFKPQIGNIKPGLSFSDSVENEWLCAQIVREFGLPVAKCEIREFEEIKVLVVERFDRQWTGDGEELLIRIPQEDMCQALAVPSFEKYQSDGGPGIVKIMDVLNESQKRDEDRNLFMKTQIAFFLLAAIDGHAKNFSVRWGPKGFWMTPLYDILSVQPVIDSGALNYHKVKMAMGVGDKPHWRVNEIIRRHLVQTAKLAKYETRKMEESIDQMISQLPNVINAVSQRLPKNFPEEIAESIFAGMSQRVKSLD